jgi:hypothetical protein
LKLRKKRSTVVVDERWADDWMNRLGRESRWLKRLLVSSAG